MYAPLYHWIWGGVIWLTGWQSLVLGRLISLAGLAGALSALAFGSARRTGQAVAAFFSAFLFLAFFGPSGCWYDLARIDMLAVGLMLWGVVLLPECREEAWKCTLAWTLLGLASLTKQSIAPITLMGWMWILWRNRQSGTLLVLGTVLIGATHLQVHAQTGSSWFWFWVFEAPRRHASDWASVLWPLTDGRPSRAWTEAFAPTLIPLLLVGAHFADRGEHRATKSDWLLFAMLAVALATGLVGLAKFGGFRNNLLPFFGLLSLLAGMAFWWLLAACGESRLFGSAMLGGLLLLQAWQPWGGHRWLYDPRTQLPESGARAAWDAFQGWLEERHGKGERVWVVHHQWMSMRAGHPAGYNADMVRVAEWAGIRVPWGALEPTARGEYDWIVLDRELAEEWLPSGLADFIGEGYQLTGSVESMLGKAAGSFSPVTGAEMAPAFVWIRTREVSLEPSPENEERPVDKPEPANQN
jgi:hypothetical protein